MQAEAWCGSTWTEGQRRRKKHLTHTEEKRKSCMKLLFFPATALDCTAGARLRAVMGSTCRRGCGDERRSAEMSRPAAALFTRGEAAAGASDARRDGI